MKHSGSARFALTLLACLACPIAGNALRCPPGKREECGRCIPIPDVHHFEKKSEPQFESLGTRSEPRFETRISPDAETSVKPNSETAAPADPPRHDPVKARDR